MKNTSMKIFSTLCLGIAACGDGAIQKETPIADASSVHQAMRAAEAGFGERDREVETMACAEGGSLAGATTQGAVTRLVARQSAERVFTNCAVDGIVLNGGLTWQVATEENPEIVRRTGLINFAGRVQGACELEEVYKVERSASDDIKLVMQSNRLCGHDLDINAQDLANNVQDAAKDAKDSASQMADKAGDKATDAKDSAKDAAERAGDKAGDIADKAGDQATDVKDSAKHAADQAASKAGDVADKASDQAAGAQDKAKEAAKDAGAKAGEMADRAGDKAGEIADGAGKKAADVKAGAKRAAKRTN